MFLSQPYCHLPLQFPQSVPLLTHPLSASTHPKVYIASLQLVTLSASHDLRRAQVLRPSLPFLHAVGAIRRLSHRYLTLLTPLPNHLYILPASLTSRTPESMGQPPLILPTRLMV